jgi:hypothetical protein
MYDKQMAMDSASSGIQHYFCSQLLFYSMDSLMKPGNLVRITRNAIGIPAGTLALCLQRHQKRGDYDAGLEIWSVQLMNGKCRGRERRYLDVDLVEV